MSFKEDANKLRYAKSMNFRSLIDQHKLEFDDYLLPVKCGTETIEDL